MVSITSKLLLFAGMYAGFRAGGRCGRMDDGLCGRVHGAARTCAKHQKPKPRTRWMDGAKHQKPKPDYTNFLEDHNTQQNETTPERNFVSWPHHRRRGECLRRNNAHCCSLNRHPTRYQHHHSRYQRVAQVSRSPLNSL